MNLGGVLYMLGRILLGLALPLLVPTAVAFAAGGPDRWPFAATLVVTVGAGLGLCLRFPQAPGFAFERRDAFLLVTLAWLVAALAGALPWVFTKGPAFLVDGLFESTAGFTTTGASILTDIESQPAGLLLWRSMSQWLGGMGIIVLGIAILPRLSKGGVALLSAEAPGPIQEKLTPRIARTAKALWGIYVLLTALAFAALWAAGMTPFEAVNHAFTTLSTGGFSTRNAGITGFESTAIELIITAFMIVAGLNFALFYRLLSGKVGPLREDPEVRLYSTIIIGATLAIAADLALDGLGVFDSLRLALFQVVSIQTTTGFATADFDAWPRVSRVVLFLLFFVGGCAGSTSGSIKVVRLQILLKKILGDMRRMVQPHAVVPIRQGSRVIPADVVTAVTSFIALFVLLFAAGGAALTCLGLDPAGAFSASVACLANVGPGFGSVGPASNFAALHPLAKLILVALMIVGRLELYTVLVLFWLIPFNRRSSARVVVAAKRKRRREALAKDPKAQPFASARYPRAKELPTEESGANGR